jgi:hypothetical protein
MSKMKTAKKICLKSFWLIAMLWCGKLAAAVPANAPVINSIAVTGSNLDFVVTLSPGVDRAVLEMRPTLPAEWQLAATLNVPAAGGVIEFTCPKPALDTAFFRLNASLVVSNNSSTSPPAIAVTTNTVSAELQYVAVPPLGPDATHSDEAVFHFKGMIDGSDRIVITREGALWQHVNWGWPAGAVTVNDTRWNPSGKNFLTTTGAVAFLPEKYSLTVVGLEKIEGRDVIALERTNAALIVYLDDTPPGAAPYEFKIHFKKASVKFPAIRRSRVAMLKIAAQIDGSDFLKITKREATWQHGTWSPPGSVRLNDVAWDLGETNVLMNVGTNTFLPAGVDFSTAKIIHRQGRDVGTLWADTNALWVSFADNPIGADAYELDISFGQ